MEKLRLLVTTKCPNKCPMCCNNSWDFSKLPVVEHFNYKEIMITGGEPLLFPEKLSNLAESIRTVQKLAYGNKGKSISVLVHKLCAFQKYGYIAFSYECIRHLDGNRTNNILENIEIGSYSDNQLDKSPEERKREATIASHSHIMKWNEEEVAMIKNYHKTSHSYRKTMTRFGISSKGTLHFILKNR